MKTLWIRYGGSCRKMDRHQRILKGKFPEFRDGGSIGSGHWSNRSGCIDDTEQNRAIILTLKDQGIRIDKNMMKIANQKY